MLHKAEKALGGDVASEMIDLLNWAEESGVIMKAQHNTLVREFSRRVESRERREINGVRVVGVKRQSTDNLLSMGAAEVGRTLQKHISLPYLGREGRDSFGPGKGVMGDNEGGGDGRSEQEQFLNDYSFSEGNRKGDAETKGDGCVIA